MVIYNVDYELCIAYPERSGLISCSVIVLPVQVSVTSIVHLEGCVADGNLAMCVLYIALTPRP